MSRQYVTPDPPNTVSTSDIDTNEHIWIPMPDGTRLSARIWKPLGENPAPAILEYIPYRKRDMVRLRDERNHPFFARNGYACLRVDMRGSGDSEGAMPDMYDQCELDDARHVIDWVAAQLWCNGKVGMFGTSWGGTASLQAAVNAPEPLKAVIANSATIDRFEDDIHWMGGCLLTDSLEWGATLPAILAAPPDLATTGEDWLAIWKQRLNQTRFPFENWARHDRRGTYWRHGSVFHQADHLSCPVLIIGGWSDRYSNSVMKLTEARPDLCCGIVGPWGHHYPDKGEPGPAMNFQHTALQWWNQWLKPDEHQPAQRPRLTIWRREFDPPQDRLQTRNGQWLACDDLHAEDGETYHLAAQPGAGVLTTVRPDEDGLLDVPFDLRHGECAGDTGYFGRIGGLPLDQSPDDARALCFDTQNLTTNIDLFGHARLEMEIGAERMPAQIACRICEVLPDGRSNLVTRTVLALELDETLDGLRQTEPGQPQHYRITFPAVSYRFSAGNRIRLALGASYWPLVWPVSSITPLKVNTAGAVLSLPLQPRAVKEIPSPFQASENYAGDSDHDNTSEGELERIPPAAVDGIITQGWHQPGTTTTFSTLGLHFTVMTSTEYTIGDNAPETATCTIDTSFRIRRDDGEAIITSRIMMQAESGGAAIKSSLEVSWKNQDMLSKTHSFFITDRN
ncbi:MAG: CocE/NonD family hydrolase [Parvularculales bacterium]